MTPAAPVFDRCVIVVADGVGCGGAADAAAYGDAGADTLGNLARAQGGLDLPNLGALGLGNLTEVDGVPPVARPDGAWGRMAEASAGKDTITGHWEMAGLVTTTALPTYPAGFPPALMAALEAAAGRPLIGNKPASGTAIIEELGPEHQLTGALIVYTSADSVLQIAAHESVVSVAELHAICTKARAIADRYGIGRVIARPFVGKPGHFKRTYQRRDWPLEPPGPTLLDNVCGAGLDVFGVGKIEDIFAGQGLTQSFHSEGNRDGMDLTLRALAEMQRGLLFVNLVDFDMLYGHRNDRAGFAAALVEFDHWVGLLRRALQPGDAVFITADHGNDPTHPGTDHTREQVPLLVFGPQVANNPLGTRASFCDLGQTIAAGLGVGALASGVSFLDTIAV